MPNEMELGLWLTMEMRVLGINLNQQKAYIRVFRGFSRGVGDKGYICIDTPHSQPLPVSELQGFRVLDIISVFRESSGFAV